MRRERLGGAKRNGAGTLGDDLGILAGRALRPRIDSTAQERDRRRQRDPRFGLVDPESPAGAGRIPIKFVVIRKKSKLPGGEIADHEFMRTEAQHAIRIADAYFNAVALAFGGERFAIPVASDRLDIEADPDTRSVTPCVDCREIAQNAVLELIAFGLDPNRLGDLQVAVLQHVHVADEPEDALGAGRRCEPRQ